MYAVSAIHVILCNPKKIAILIVSLDGGVDIEHN